MLREALLAPPYSEDAICSQTDPEAFFPEKGGSVQGAKRVCLGCPVRDACLQYALDHDERYGVWGGYSERERRRIRDGQLTPVVTLPPFDVDRYTRDDGHGYRGYKDGCKCGVCRLGWADYLRDYQVRSGNRIVRQCEVCGIDVHGRGRTRYCTDACKSAAKQQRAHARGVAA